MVADRQRGKAAGRILLPRSNIEVEVAAVDVYDFYNTNEQRSRVAIVGGDGGSWAGTPFEPLLNTTILIVGSVDGIFRVDEDGLWFCTDSAITGKRNCRRIPCGIRAELGLIERETCNEI